jgi:hypothetical protein
MQFRRNNATRTTLLTKEIKLFLLLDETTDVRVCLFDSEYIVKNIIKLFSQFKIIKQS